FRAASVFRGDARQSNLSAQAPAQKALKQWMQPILFAASVTRHRHEDISAHQRGQHSRSANIPEQSRTGVEVNSIEQGNSHQELLNLGLFLPEHFFSEVVENVSFRLPQHRQRINLLLVKSIGSLSLAYLADQLQRRDPTMRALAVFAQLF